jgi:hypothetical protein
VSYHLKNVAVVISPHILLTLSISYYYPHLSVIDGYFLRTIIKKPRPEVSTKLVTGRAHPILRSMSLDADNPIPGGASARSVHVPQTSEPAVTLTSGYESCRTQGCINHRACCYIMYHEYSMTPVLSYTRLLPKPYFLCNVSSTAALRHPGV